MEQMYFLKLCASMARWRYDVLHVIHSPMSITECDIEYIHPASYEPPEEETNGSTNGTKNGFDDDAYERIVKNSLQHLEKQKVINRYHQCNVDVIPKSQSTLL